MKSITINVAAAWAGTLTVWQDGDILRETNTDTVYTAIANRLGYLKAQSDTFVAVDDDPVTWTGTHTFATTTIDELHVLSGGTLVGTWSNVGSMTFASTKNVTFVGEGAGVLGRRSEGSDAATTFTTAADVVSVPTLTANRVYTARSTGPVPSFGAQVRVVRARTADAFSLEIRREDATSLATISASAAGWVDLFFTTKWIVVGYGGTVTGINTDIS